MCWEINQLESKDMKVLYDDSCKESVTSLKGGKINLETDVCRMTKMLSTNKMWSLRFFSLIIQSLSCLYGKFIISHNPSYSFRPFTILQLVFLSNRLTSKMN